MISIKLIGKLEIIIDWIKTKLSKKQFILFSSVLVGLSVGLAAVILKTFVHYIFLLSTLGYIGQVRYLPIILPIVGLFLTVIAIKYLLKGKLEKGLWHIHYAIAKKSSELPKEQMYAQILTSSITVGFGGSAGLEAPIVITGAAFGSNYSKAYKLNYKEKTLLVACGIAAGIGAAFNAPIAGVLFALEVLLIDISIPAFTPIIISAATGALISKIILQDDLLLSFQLQQPFNYVNLPFYVLLGLFAGMISIYHSRVFTKVESFFNKSSKYRYINVVIGGVALGLLIFIFPSLFGEGYNSIKMLANQHPENLLQNSAFQQFSNNGIFVLLFVGAIIFFKAIATGLTIGSGGNGGNFAPSLFVGSYLGFFFSKSLNMLGVSNLPISNFTIVGMAGILSGIYHAPLTAIFLIAEITGGYTLIIPLMIVASISYVVSKYFEPYSMDSKSLAKSGELFTHDRDHNILTTIQTTNLIETDFQKLYPNDTLDKIIEVVSNSNRNIFPVTNKENILLGIINLNDIKSIIFDPHTHLTVNVQQLMSIPSIFVYPSDDMDVVMQKFDNSGLWNLPVVENNYYIGFISKSAVFSLYRNQLKSNIIE